MVIGILIEDEGAEGEAVVVNAQNWKLAKRYRLRWSHIDEELRISEMGLPVYRSFDAVGEHSSFVATVAA